MSSRRVAIGLQESHGGKRAAGTMELELVLMSESRYAPAKVGKTPETSRYRGAILA